MFGSTSRCHRCKNHIRQDILDVCIFLVGEVVKWLTVLKSVKRGDNSAMGVHYKILHKPDIKLTDQDLQGYQQNSKIHILPGQRCEEQYSA